MIAALPPWTPQDSLILAVLSVLVFVLSAVALYNRPRK